ncbi:eCIS core domain-containing protein [Aureibacter tunicatorum]|uniref:eCIS core domain-containing protein n=1 Tax=Aureibacter tunicatorum TaxID=866807 RepID=A0AAE4BS37_9BACT|nr:DUF4157 domain-containing protein [Aureibacter tunicatorum]MDR6238483.1 hypothetical protein [Aureibacter tunicatorum]BDD05584.1 hypothetical protein AUTU_30670 [Aureibacter tunicatorum]
MNQSKQDHSNNTTLQFLADQKMKANWKAVQLKKKDNSKSSFENSNNDLSIAQLHADIEAIKSSEHFKMWNTPPSGDLPAQKKENSTTRHTNLDASKSNNTGLPHQLKTGVENLSGYSMDDVKVHYNSDKPAQLQAHAFAQGTDIHIASGQEKHLPHEAWHVVQQKQGRVKPTMQMKGKVNINDDAGLEKEADEMGAKAIDYSEKIETHINLNNSRTSKNQGITQRLVINAQSNDRGVRDAVNSTVTHRQWGDDNNELNEQEARNHHQSTVYENSEDNALSDFNNNEPIHIVGHGAVVLDDKNVGFRAITIGNKSPEELVEFFNRTNLPKDFTGLIYLQACYSAAGYHKSFLERFRKCMFKNGWTSFKIKGNLGSSRVTNGAIDIQDQNKETAALYWLLSNSRPIIEEIKNTPLPTLAKVFRNRRRQFLEARSESVVEIKELLEEKLVNVKVEEAGEVKEVKVAGEAEAEETTPVYSAESPENTIITPASTPISLPNENIYYKDNEKYRNKLIRKSKSLIEFLESEKFCSDDLRKIEYKIKIQQKAINQIVSLIERPLYESNENNN